jgi:tRNA 5-methylaminomethyl-2-thiouridine biosynthesis bifunctional protein
VAEADVVCLAAGMACSTLATGLPLTAVRGQASVAADVAWPMATLFGGYVLPTGEGLMFGATHDRGDEGVEIRRADNVRNLEVLSKTLPKLAERLRGAPSLSAHAATRATTTDYLPLAGVAPGAPAGLFVLTGLGSRGFTLAPLLAEHVAALALGQSSPLPARVAVLVDPGRFARRVRRRLGGDRPGRYDGRTGAIEA